MLFDTTTRGRCEFIPSLRSEMYILEDVAIFMRKRGIKVIVQRKPTLRFIFGAKIGPIVNEVRSRGVVSLKPVPRRR